MSLNTTWGTTPHEREMDFPCDRFMEQPYEAYFRGITISAKSEVIFRWLCQMRVAPYSYDWIDNRGRRSPRVLTPGLDELAVGQTIMSSFELVEFEHGRHLTGRLRQKSREGRFIPGFVITYLIVSENAGRCRLLVKFVAKYPKGPLGLIMRVFLPWADLIMMRKQLLNFKRLSEQSATGTGGAP